MSIINKNNREHHSFHTKTKKFKQKPSDAFFQILQNQLHTYSNSKLPEKVSKRQFFKKKITQKFSNVSHSSITYDEQNQKSSPRTNTKASKKTACVYNTCPTKVSNFCKPNFSVI